MGLKLKWEYAFKRATNRESGHLFLTISKNQPERNIEYKISRNKDFTEIKSAVTTNKQRVSKEQYCLQCHPAPIFLILVSELRKKVFKQSKKMALNEEKKKLEKPLTYKNATLPFRSFPNIPIALFKYPLRWKTNRTQLLEKNYLLERSEKNTAFS